MATDIAANTRSIIGELATAIQETEDPVRLEELLEINDQLLGLLKKLPAAGKASKPILSLSGLGLSLNGGTPGKNGIVNGSSVLPQDAAEDDEEEEADTPTTPRVDKGKRRADPEPEEIEKVLSPAFLISETSEDEDEDPGYGTPPEEGEIPGMPSPTDR
jgi:protein phosphatase 1 regulatory subunit 37